MNFESNVIEIRRTILEHAIERHENEISFLKHEIESLSGHHDGYA